MAEHIPNAQSFSIFVPGSFCLIGWTAGTPRKSWQVRDQNVNATSDQHSAYWSASFLGGGAYQLEKSHNRRSCGRSLSSRSPQPKTNTAPTQTHGTHWKCSGAAWYSWSCTKVDVGWHSCPSLMPGHMETLWSYYLTTATLSNCGILRLSPYSWKIYLKIKLDCVQKLRMHPTWSTAEVPHP